LVNEEEVVHLDWEKKFETKTSYVLKTGTDIYNVTLESVI